ncbi:MAG: hypothetical protein JWM33_2822 [Caulobacteraceae bacterium]|nr:hypothetical protein [Caulobacteraceae bacterium]
MGSVAGTDNSDTLTGDADDDFLYGGLGSDSLTGAAGIDREFGGAGDDVLYGGDDADTLVGGPGADQLYGGAGNDLLYVTTIGAGSFYNDAPQGDQVSGGDGSDRAIFYLTGQTDAYSLDISNQAATASLLRGGLAVASLSSIEVISVYGGSGNDQFVGADAADTMLGGGGDDHLVGNGGSDTLDGGIGDDLLAGGAGNDILTGGGGTDTAVFSGPRSSYTLSFLASGLNISGPDGADQLNSIEFLRFDDVTVSYEAERAAANAAAAAIVVTGTNGADVLHGLPNGQKASAWIEGGDGGDVLYGGNGGALTQGGVYLGGGAGDDILHSDGPGVLAGGAGDDALYATYAPSASLSTAWGGDGRDLISGVGQFYGGQGDDVLINIAVQFGKPAQSAVLEGGAGDDLLISTASPQATAYSANATASYMTSVGAVHVDLSLLNPQDTGAAGRDTLIGLSNLGGSAYDDVLRGDDGANVLSGAQGDDQLYGGDGDDILDPGPGNALLYGGDGTDMVTYATGQFSTADGAVTVDLRLTGPQQTFSGGVQTLSSIEDLTGTSYGDTLIGNAGDNRLHGGGGNDTLMGMEGGDILYVDGTGTLLVDGGSGFDRVSYASRTTGVTVSLLSQGVSQNTGVGMHTLVGIEEIEGGSGADVLTGDGGSFALYGGAGDDTLTGGLGGDVIYGGDGVDTAVFAGPRSAYSFGPSIGAMVHVSGPDGNDDLIDVEKLQFSDQTVTLSTTPLTVTWFSKLSPGVTVENQSGFLRALGTDGDDQVNVIHYNAAVYGGDGVDTVSFADQAFPADAGINIGNQIRGAWSLENVENLIGTGFADTLSGDDGNNILQGRGGDDTLAGLGGFDLLDGSDGLDKAVFADVRSAYSMMEDGLGGVIVAHKAAGGVIDGAAHLLNMEIVQFADQTLDLGTVSPGDMTPLPASALSNLAGFGITLGTDGPDDLVGRGGTDLLFGGLGDDVLHGQGGENWLDGGAGFDLVSYAAAANGVTASLNANAPQDTGASTDALISIEGLIGSALDDVLEGNADDNKLYGGLGADTVSYASAGAGVVVNLSQTGAQNTLGAGNDTLAGFENLTGSAFNDALTGDAGANVLQGLAGDDSLNGAGGSDTVSYSAAAGSVTVSLALSGPQDTHGAGVDSLASIENLIGSAFSDALTGDAGSNLLQGGDGDDILEGGGGDDRLDGGAGLDTADYSHASSAVQARLETEATNIGFSGTTPFMAYTGFVGSGMRDGVLTNLDSIYGTINTANANIVANLGVVAPIEALLTAPANQSAPGGWGPAYFDGAHVETSIDGVTWTSFGVLLSADYQNYTVIDFGGVTAQYIRLRMDANNLGVGDFRILTAGVSHGGDGADVLLNIENLTGSAYGDNLLGNEIANVIYGLTGDDVIEGGADNDSLYGGDGVDTASYASASTAVFVNLSLSSAQNTGGAGVDVLSSFENLTGSAFDDSLAGDGGANVIEGGAGNDLLNGGAGLDTASYASAAAGVSVSLALTTAQNTIGAGTDTLSGLESLTGSAFNDTLIGDSGANVLSGGAGDDLLQGGAGNDSLSGEAGTDTASYASATSAVTVSLAVSTAQTTGGAGNDTLSGLENLVGSAFADHLNGDGGVNLLTGGAGNDTLDGGANVDTAVFSGAMSAYTITGNGGTVTVVGPDGTDTLTNIELLQFSDQTFHFRSGAASTVDFTAAPSTYAAALRDFDGNDLGGTGSWVLAGHVDIQDDGDQEYILFNQQIGRWATIGPAADGKVYFDDHGWAGDTRVVGIYIDPEVQLGHAALGGPNDSQRRFQNDLNIGNLKGILGSGDYNHDGLQEVYFSLTDGTAYLHAYMHADGNIQYANYQSQQQVIDYLTANGFTHTTWDGWF